MNVANKVVPAIAGLVTLFTFAATAAPLDKAILAGSVALGAYGVGRLGSAIGNGAAFLSMNEFESVLAKFGRPSDTAQTKIAIGIIGGALIGNAIGAPLGYAVADQFVGEAPQPPAMVEQGAPAPANAVVVGGQQYDLVLAA